MVMAAGLPAVNATVARRCPGMRNETADRELGKRRLRVSSRGSGCGGGSGGWSL